MKPFFTVCAACCDVAPFLAECFDSLLGQSFADWECVVCAETSKDGTEELLRGYAARDPRFRVFPGPRSGSVSVSRNRGIEEARGDYLVFLDGDDLLAPEALARLHDAIAARPGADVYPCSMAVRNEATGREEPVRDNYPADFAGELPGPEATRLVYSRLREPCPMLQLAAFRREFLVSNGLRCLPGVRRQDSEFAARARYLAARVVPTHVPLYVYRIRRGSVSTAAKRDDYFLSDYAAILSSLSAFHADVSARPGFDRRLSALWARHWLTWLFFYWFSPRAVSLSPRAARAETLRAAFGGDPRRFDALLRASTRVRRVAGFFAKLAVRRPSAMRLADFFFTKFYFPLTQLRDRARGSAAR